MMSSYFAAIVQRLRALRVVRKFVGEDRIATKPA